MRHGNLVKTLCLLVWLLTLTSLSLSQISTDWSNLFAKASPSIIALVSPDAKDIPKGSGFLISDDGKIVTNFHAVKSGGNLLVRFYDGSLLPVKDVLAKDEAKDLAILKVEGKNLPFLQLGDSEAVKSGDEICLMGSQFLAEGVLGVGFITGFKELMGVGRLFQTDAFISEGISGAPVFNPKGEVIGIASFHLSQAQNINLLIPINDLKALLKQPTEKPSPPSKPIPLDLSNIFDQALHIAKSITGETERSFTLSAIAEVMAKAGRFEQAIQIAKGIDDADDRALALKNIAEEMAKAGMKEQAQTVFEQALQAARSVNESSERSSTLSVIAQAMAKAGQFERTLQVVREFTYEKGLPLKLLALCYIAEEMAKAKVENKTLWEEIVQLARSIEKTDDRSLALRSIAQEMAKAGQIEQALQLAKSFSEPFWQSSTLKSIVEVMAKAKVKEQALWEKIVQVARSIENEWWRSKALSFIAEAMAKADMKEQAFQIAQSIPEPSHQVLALIGIARVLLGVEE